MKLRVILSVFASIVIIVIGSSSLSAIENTLLSKFVPDYIEYSLGFNPPSGYYNEFHKHTNPSLVYYTVEYGALIAHVFVVVVSGVLAGWLVRRKGWFFGGIGAVIFAIGTIFIALYALFLPNPTYDIYTSIAGIPVKYDKVSNLFSAFFYGSLITIQAGVGGFIGEKLYHNKYAIRSKLSRLASKLDYPKHDFDHLK